MCNGSNDAGKSKEDNEGSWRAHLNDALSIAKCTYAADDITLG